MASALRRQQDREHREPRGIRIRLRLHRDPAEHELRSALKLADRQQNYVRQCRPWEDTIIASKGEPFCIRRNGGPLPRARKRTSKVLATGSNLRDAQVVRQDSSFSFAPKHRKQEALLEKPPVAETKKNIEDAIRPATVVETDLQSSYGKEFVDFIPEQLQTPPNAQLAPKLKGQKIQIKAEKSSQKTRRKADKKKQKQIEANAKQIRKRLKADYRLASGNSEHFAAWAEAYQKLAERPEDAVSVHLKPENNDHRTGHLRWLKGLLHRKASTKQYEQVDAKEIPDLGPWLKPELEATSIPPHVLEHFYAELPAYCAVEIGDCEEGKEVAANLSNNNPSGLEELPLETGDPSMPVNKTSPQACTSCGTSISCLPGAIFYECDVYRDEGAQVCCSCYDNEVRQCCHGCQELIQEDYSHENKFPALSWGPTAQEYEVAESRSWQPSPFTPCPTHPPHTLSFPQSSPPEDHSLLASATEQTIEDNSLTSSVPHKFDTAESRSWQPSPFTPCPTNLPYTLSFPQSPPPQDHGLMASAMEQTIEDNSLTSSAPHQIDTAESRSWQPSPFTPCPTHPPYTLSFPQSPPPQDHSLMASATEQTIEDNSLTSSAPHQIDMAESRSWQPSPFTPSSTHPPYTLSFPQSPPPRDHSLMASATEQTIEDNSLTSSAPHKFDTAESSSLGPGLLTIQGQQSTGGELIKSNLTDRLLVEATPELRESVRDVEHSPTREIPFRDILSLGTPQDRILAFDTSRRVVANQDTGLERWLQAMGNDLPQHSDIFAAEKSRMAEMKQASEQRIQLPAHPNIFGADKLGMVGMKQGIDQQAQLLKQLEEELASAKLTRAQHERVLAEHREELMALRENLTRREKEVALREQRETLQERYLLSRMAEVSRREREASLREREASIRERDASAREREASVHEREALFREQALLARQSETMPSQQTTSLQEATRVSSVQTPKLRCTRTPSQAPRQDITPLSQQSPHPFRTSNLRPTSRERSTETAEVGRGQPPDVPPRSVNPTEEPKGYSRAAEETEPGASPFGNKTGHDLLRIVSQAVGDAVSALFKFKKTSFRTHAGTKRKASGRVASGKGSSRPRSRHRSRLRPVAPDEDEVNDDEDSDGRLRKRKKQNTVLPNLGERLLACPYSKFDCSRYSERNTGEKQYRGCKKCWLSDISRVKQHLYRVHSRPDYYCPRCYEVFESSIMLDGHVRQTNSCIVDDCPFPEKFTDVQMKELKRKWPGKTAEECWYIIFGILFPNSLVPASPYAEDNSPEAPTQLMVPNAPRVLSQIFRERLSQLEHTPATAALLSNEAQTLLGRMIEEAMTEMLHRTVSPDTSLLRSTLLMSANGEQPLSHYSHGISTEQEPSMSSGSLPGEVHSDPLSGNIAQPPHSVASGHLDRHGELRNQHSNPPIAEIHPPGPTSAERPKSHSASVDSSSLKSTLSSSATVNTHQNDALSDHFGPHQRPDEPLTAHSALYHPDQLHSLPATTGNCNPFYPNMSIMRAIYNHFRNATSTSSDINFTSSGTSSTESLSLQTPSLIDLNNDVDCMPPVLSQESGLQLSPDEVIRPRRSIDSGYQSLLTQGQGDLCFNNANEDLAWLDEGLYEAIGASWGPMTAMMVPANPQDWTV